MNKLYTVIKNELLRYFISPLAYVYLVAFLLLNGSFAIYFGGFLERGLADLTPMFAYQPWLYLLFIPGISMRLWSEEFRTKTIVQIMTMPVSILTLVLGKFFASLIFCAIALALTFPFWITVNFLGTPDNQVVILSYLGSLTIAACMLAISQTMSALTKNQVIALVLAVIANLIFFLSGIEYVLAFFRLFAPISIIDMIASFSFLSHMNTLMQGLLEFRDIVFFVSIILLFNFTTTIIISFKTAGTSSFLKSGNRNYYIAAFVMIMLAFVGLNLTANNLLRGQQFDFTEDKNFTLTDTTKVILQNLPEKVTARIYYSKELEQRNPAIRIALDKLRTMLGELEKSSGGNFSYKIYNPQPLDNNEDMAYAIGLQPIPIIESGQNAFFGMSLTDTVDNQEIIPFFPLERQNFLEQDIVEKIYQLFHKKKTLGIITGLPVFDTQMSDNYVTQEWEVITQIKKFYNVKSINKAEDFKDIDVLMMIHPQKLSDEIIEAVKTYSKTGGNTLLLMDVAAEAPRIFSPVNLDFTPSDIGSLADFWGIKFYNDLIISDLDNSIMVDATQDYKSNPLFVQDVVQFILKDENFNKNSLETRELKKILFASVSMIRPTSNSKAFIPLIKAGDNSGFLSNKVIYEELHPSYILSLFTPDEFEKIIAAKIINKDPSEPYTVIAVADSDFIYNSFWAQSQTILDTNYFVPIFDNANFVLNSLESLAGGDNLIELRGRTKFDRPFIVIDKIRKESRLEFKLKEDDIFNKINEVKEKLQQIISSKQAEKQEIFTPDEIEEISALRQELEVLRENLADIKKMQDMKIHDIYFWVKLLNIYVLPLLILLALAITNFHCRRSSEKIDINAPLVKLSAVCLVILFAGIGSVYWSNISTVDEMRGELVFENLKKQVNDVEKIVIKTENGESALVQKDEIKELLAILMNATYFEKKSDKAEHLSKFGFSPSEVKQIILENAEGKPILSFELGHKNIDIGRGGKGAYIKFPNEFQVWLIRAEL